MRGMPSLSLNSYYMYFGYQIMLIGYHFDCCFNKKAYLCIVNKYIELWL